MKNKILISGHNGFLGSYLYKFLKRNNYNILGKDINLYSNHRNYKKNFTKTETKLLNNISTIIHLAGISTNYDPNEKIYKKRQMCPFQ